MKKVWITSLVKDETLVATLLATAKRYGLDADGHFWVDDLEHMAWQAPTAALVDGQADLWVIVGSAEAAATASIRYGLSLLALCLQAGRGNGFPILWVATDGDPDTAALPTPLRGAAAMAADNTALGAKIVARANTPAPTIETDYRLSVHANPGFGVWVEVGPRETDWAGALLGVSGGGIDAHGVGPAGRLPTKTVLEYPMKGLTLALGEKKYTAWAVQNALGPDASYYVRITDTPGSLLFGPYSQEDAAEVHVLDF